MAQFASKEAIANTPRSPQLDDIVPQIDGSVNSKTENSEKLSEHNSDGGFSNRTLLANALESAVKDPNEAKRLEEYKSRIRAMSEEQKKLEVLRGELKSALP